jgi:hypothetical protein
MITGSPGAATGFGGGSLGGQAWRARSLSPRARPIGAQHLDHKAEEPDNQRDGVDVEPMGGDADGEAQSRSGRDQKSGFWSRSSSGGVAADQAFDSLCGELERRLLE